MAQGAAAGEFEVKTCGKAHAWCRICRPDMVQKFRKPKPPRRAYDRPCRNCGRCDACLGLSAPEGMKHCRQCGEVKPVTAFARRADTGGRRNQCIGCHNRGQTTLRCESCGRTVAKSAPGRTLCARCRPPLTKPCAQCGTAFVGSMDQRRYCSTECRDAALAAKRVQARRRQRAAALAAYSATAVPSCVCCGETILAFLAIDHVNGGGSKHRQETGGGGFYVWLKRNGYPDGFQVLCHNCNFGRQINGGTCPHREVTAVA